jgi:hypothetical protein
MRLCARNRAFAIKLYGHFPKRLAQVLSASSSQIGQMASPLRRLAQDVSLLARDISWDHGAIMPEARFLRHAFKHSPLTSRVNLPRTDLRKAFAMVASVASTYPQAHRADEFLS